jgi:hypothetical protein
LGAIADFTKLREIEVVHYKCVPSTGNKFDVFEIADRRRDSTFPKTHVMHTFKHLAEALIQKRLLDNLQLKPFPVSCSLSFCQAWQRLTSIIIPKADPNFCTRALEGNHDAKHVIRIDFVQQKSILT